MRALGKGVVPGDARADFNKIATPVVALKCRVKLPLAPFIQRVLSGIPLHPL